VPARAGGRGRRREGNLAEMPYQILLTL